MRVIIIDVRNGQVYEDGSNINLPEEGIVPALRAISEADTVVEISADSMFVKKGVHLGIVGLVTTKSVLQMNAEKAAREKTARTANEGGDLEKGDHPVEVKMARVWSEEYRGSSGNDTITQKL